MEEEPWGKMVREKATAVLSLAATLQFGEVDRMVATLTTQEELMGCMAHWAAFTKTCMANHGKYSGGQLIGPNEEALARVELAAASGESVPISAEQIGIGIAYINAVALEDFDATMLLLKPLGAPDQWGAAMTVLAIATITALRFYGKS
jgi:hypothetical protein